MSQSKKKEVCTRPTVQQQVPKCEYCGYNAHNTCENQRPAKGKQCWKCLKYNHFASVCRSTATNKVQEVAQCEYEDDMFIGYVEQVNAVLPGDWQETLEINGEQVTVLQDTGAKCNLMSVQTFKSLGLKTQITPTTSTLESYSGHVIKLLGETTIECR